LQWSYIIPKLCKAGCAAWRHIFILREVLPLI